MNTPIFDTGSFAQATGTMPSMHCDTYDPDTPSARTGKISMHCDTWAPEPTEPDKRSSKISMHCDTWNPDTPSSRSGRISMHCDTWVPEPEEPQKRTAG